MKKTKKLIALLLTSSISLTSGCAIIKSVEKKELKVTNNNYAMEDEVIESEEKIIEDTSISFIQEDAVRAIVDAEIIKDNKVVGYLPKDEELKVSEELEGAYQVYYNDDLCNISKEDVIKDYITTPQNPYISIGYLTDNTNLYNNKSEDCIVKELNKYEAVYIYKEEKNNFYVMSDNNIGYVEKDAVEILNGTFVIVDISSQHLELYENNELILTSPVVTGKDKLKPTKIGLHEIYRTDGHRDLVGRDGSRHYVDVMNSFYDDQGLHDAEYHIDYDEAGNVKKKHGWRDHSEFGGYTFLKHGSQGCVNMPHDEAVELDKHVDMNDKVLVKR